MELNENDIISRIPEDILATILSRIPSEESARTSIVAKMWVNIWKISVKDVSMVYRYPSPSYKFLMKLSVHDKIAHSLKIEKFLKDCSVLENFRLSSPSIQSLTVDCKSLKKLEILKCPQLKTLELIAPKLVFLKYVGHKTKFDILKVPSLVEVSFAGVDCAFLVGNKFKQFEPILEQLEKLNLIQDYPFVVDFPTVNGFKNIKKVQLDIMIKDYLSPLMLFRSIIETLPSLEVLHLRLCWPVVEETTRTNSLWFENRRQKHKLRVFILEGFIGNWYEEKIIKYVVQNNSVLLDKLVIRLSKYHSVESHEDQMSTELRKKSMIYADTHIGKLVKKPTKFTIE